MADVVSFEHARETDELELLVLQIEQARASSMSGNHEFLTYLLGMARIEAATILESKRRQKA